MIKKQIIEVIKEIRKREQKAFEQSVFCNDHNFKLEAAKFDAVEKELRSICRLLETEFETGYIAYP